MHAVFLLGGCCVKFDAMVLSLVVLILKVGDYGTVVWFLSSENSIAGIQRSRMHSGG